MKEAKSIRICNKRKAKESSIHLSKLSNRKGGHVKRKMHKTSQKLNNFRGTTSREPGLTQYLFYAIVNTDLRMDQSTTAANIANGLMFLYSKLDADQVKFQYIDTWINEGRKIIVLKGYDHKHLKYLHSEVKFVAIETHTVHQRWGRNEAIVVLIVFGQREELEEVFEGLSFLK